MDKNLFKSQRTLLFIGFCTLLFIGLLFSQDDSNSSAPVLPELNTAETVDQIESKIIQSPEESATVENNSAPKIIQDKTNSFFGKLVGIIAPVLFYPVPITSTIKMPFLLIIMVLGGLFFTFRYRFINIRLFRHSFDVIRGKFDNPDDVGEVTHFQALTSALAATVGLGNIAGVAVAISLGGPGAVFWMWVVAFFGMSMKFSSCTFAQLYRKVDNEGQVLGGPMVYLEQGITERFPNLSGFGKLLGGLFAFLTIWASFGGGNLFQANQTYKLLSWQFPVLENYKLVIGLGLAFLVGIVIIGGIKRIGEVTCKLVPLMCLFYCSVCMLIIVSHISEVIPLLKSIVNQAVSPEAAFGGFAGVLFQGIKRASFSNEAGLGSAAIAHSAARTNEPIREGTVAMIGPFIDTHVVCTMTALSILITGSHLDPELAGEGVQITAKAFSTLGSFMPILLSVAVAIFAYSTVISWSYYGERSTVYLFGEKTVPVYRLVYVLIIILGPFLSLENVIGFADLMLLSMAFPNIIGMIIISGKVKKLADDYVNRLNSGEMKPVK